MNIPSSLIRASLVLILAGLVSCATRPASKQADNASPSPVGTFIGGVTWPANVNQPALPLLSLRLSADGTYLAEDLGPPEYTFIMEGTRAYPERANPGVERGSWSFDERTRKLFLTPEREVGFRWGIHNLRADANNPDRLEWGGSYLERKVQ